MTGSGLYGTIVAVDGDTITLESTPGNQTRWIRAAIAKLVPPADDTLVDDDDVEDDTEYDDEYDETAYDDSTGYDEAADEPDVAPARGRAPDQGPRRVAGAHRLEVPDDLSAAGRAPPGRRHRPPLSHAPLTRARRPRRRPGHCTARSRGRCAHEKRPETLATTSRRTRPLRTLITFAVLLAALFGALAAGTRWSDADLDAAARAGPRGRHAAHPHAGRRGR